MSLGITFYAPKSARECEWMNLTLTSELPLWELESQWTSKFLKGNWRGQNSLDWRVTYIIENFLERRCLKWAHMTHLGTLHTSYGQKKAWESNCQFDCRPLKVDNCPIFLCVSNVPHTIGKLSMRATILFQSSSQLKVYTQSYGLPKLQES
jgi:hypothetical protein